MCHVTTPADTLSWPAVTGVVTAREPAVTQPEEEEKEAAAPAQLPGASDSQLETGPTELETEPAVTPQRTRMVHVDPEPLHRCTVAPLHRCTVAPGPSCT
eukprot:232065-Rhodomonas_salina.2